MPDLTAESVPRLKAKVHRRLSPEQLGRISLSDLCYRPLQASDMEEMIALHQDRTVSMLVSLLWGMPAASRLCDLSLL
eukprot:Skav222991  [mRNA]  locus=scaffold1827:233262:233653:- [translate_table: standard]